MNFLEQIASGTTSVKLGPFIDAVDFTTPLTELGMTQAVIRLSKNGGDFAQKNQASAGTHDEQGFYDVLLNATDTATLGRLRIAVNETGALPYWEDFFVVPEGFFAGWTGSIDTITSIIYKLAPMTVNLVTPYVGGNDFDLLLGDDYNVTEGRSLDWAEPSDEANYWPDLSGATLAVVIESTSYTLTLVNSTPGTRILRLNLTAANTVTLGLGNHHYYIVLTLATSPVRVITPIMGTISIEDKGGYTQ